MKNERLTEATIRSLQGKLIESKFDDDEMDFESALEKIYNYYCEVGMQYEFWGDVVNTTGIDINKIKQWYNDTFGDLEENLKESRRNPLAKVGDTTNREYERALEYPEEVYQAHDVFNDYYDDQYYNSFGTKYLGCLLASIYYAISEETGEFEENYSLADAIKDYPVLKDYVDDNFSEEELKNINFLNYMEDTLTENYISHTITSEVNKLLEEKNIPIELGISFDVGSGLIVDSIKYTGYDEEKANIINELNQNDELDEIFGYGGDIDKTRYKHKQNQDSLKNNERKYSTLQSIKNDTKDLQTQIDKLQVQLNKAKNYNKAKEIKSKIDILQGQLDFKNGYLKSKLDNDTEEK